MKAQRLFPWMMEDSSEGVEIEVAVRSQFLHTVMTPSFVFYASIHKAARSRDRLRYSTRQLT